VKVIVFDLGGTLMHYVEMPHSWVDYYNQGFEAIIRRYNCNISKEVLGNSLRMLTDYNPRISKREIEYTAEDIFAQVLEHWNIGIPIKSCIETFWSGLKLKAELYPDTMEGLLKLKEKGYFIAALTDLPNAMPDEIFKCDIAELMDHIDYYVSSATAGYRKPNCKGLQMISDKYKTPISNLIFVGDEEKDRITALNANCRFVHIQRTGTNGDSISNLYELLELLVDEK